ncbi:hypothetical protein V8E36_005061 [Tilletia maclaganii]
MGIHSSASLAAHEVAMFPSVARILAEHSDVDPSKIKGTGIRGMITKGDVLAHIGEINSPLGSAKGKDKFLAGGGGVSSFFDGQSMKAKTMGSSKPATSAAPERAKPLSAGALRSLIISGLASAHPSSSLRDTAAVATTGRIHAPSFDSVVSGYAFEARRGAAQRAGSVPPPSASAAAPRSRTSAASYFQGLF